jgi:hypothetical protein
VASEPRGKMALNEGLFAGREVVGALGAALNRALIVSGAKSPPAYSQASSCSGSGAMWRSAA